MTRSLGLHRRAIVLLLIGGLALLAPLAFASPPDPLWTGGLFDAGDTDDVVGAATSTEGAPARPSMDPARMLRAPAGTVLPARAATPASSPPSTRQSRAPPAS